MNRSTSFIILSILLTMFFSCYFNPIYDTNDPTDSNQSIIIKNGTDIEYYNITYYGDNIDTTSYHIKNFNKAFAISIPEGKNRVLIIEGYICDVLCFYKKILLDDTNSKTPFSITLSTIDNSVPDKPVNLKSSKITAHSATIEWDKVSSASSYIIFKRLGVDDPKDSFAVVSNAEFTDDDLDSNTDYSYAVSAINKNGKSEKSNKISIKTKAGKIKLPDAPKSLSSENITTNSITLLWNETDNTDKYNVYRTKGDGTPDKLIKSQNNTGYTDKQLAPNTTYSYTVSSENDGGESPKSNKITVTTKKEENLPNTPDGLTVESTTCSTITIDWNYEPTATTYKVYRIVGNGTPNELICEQDSSSFIDTKLNILTTYSYAISSVNNVGESTKSDKVTAVTKICLPDVPKNVSASAVSDASIKITWDKADYADEYKVYKCDTEKGTYEKIKTLTSLSYTCGGLEADTRYYFKIKSANTTGSSEYSEIVNTKTQPVAKQKPDVPKELTAEALSDDEILLTWKSSNDAANYNIYKSTSSIGTYTKIVSTADTFYTNDDLDEDKTYYYKVSAENSVGESDKSSSVSAKTLTLIEIPTGLEAKATSPSSVDITWNSVSNATKYRLFRSLSTNGTFNEISTPTEANYTNDNLSSNTTYYYKVSAVGNSSESDKSDAVSVTTPMPIPDTPQGLTATSKSSSEISITFNTVSDADGYKIYLSSSATGSFSLLTTLGSNSYDHTGLTDDTKYYYKVSAYSNAGESDKSNSVSATTDKESTPPDAPSGVTATALSESEIKITFNTVTDAGEYSIYSSSSNNGTYTKITTITGTSYTHSSLTPNTEYFYKITASNANGESQYSSIKSATTEQAGTPPDAPTGVTATTVSKSEIRITFNSVTDAQDYKIYYSMSSSGTFNIVKTQTTTNYTHTSLNADTEYFYKIKASNQYGESGFSSMVSAKTEKEEIKKVIIDNSCNGCGRCVSQFNCPQNAIYRSGNKYKIDPVKCDGCGKCINNFNCPRGSIKWENVLRQIKDLIKRVLP